ncbi:MAG: hypothetical protein HKN14_13250 [Marinicaulis sp.]|nr:hypothetical protein [Marinicaulis sp.]
MAADKKLQIRCDQKLLSLLDDWRSRRRPILSRSAALRHLLFRGVAEDVHIDEIVQQAVIRMTDKGIIDENANPEIYKRFQRVVGEILDHLASLNENLADDSNQHLIRNVDLNASIREMHDPDKSEQEMPLDFRQVCDR